MQSQILLKHFASHSNHRLSSTSIISRIRYVLNHYWLGSKLLYNNYKSIQQIKKKDINSLTRIDKLSIDQLAYDIRVGVPFVGLFAMPIIGYTAPLVALIAPKYLPSTLIMPKQKMKFLRDDANASSYIIDSFIQNTKNEYNSDYTYGTIPIIQFINEVSDSSDRYKTILSSIPSYSSIFNQCFPLSKLPRDHVLLLHQSVLHSSFVARYILFKYTLEYQLENWQYKTFHDDKLLRNVDKLSPYNLVVCLYSRGLYLHLNEMGKVLENEQTNILSRMDKKFKESNSPLKINDNILNDWKQLLEQWIDVHIKLCQYNPVSTTFLLHVAPLLSKQ